MLSEAWHHSKLVDYHFLIIRITTPPCKATAFPRNVDSKLHVARNLATLTAENPKTEVLVGPTLLAVSAGTCSSLTQLEAAHSGVTVTGLKHLQHGV